MAPVKLNTQQRQRLQKTLQAALNRSAASLKVMLGGEINILLVPAKYPVSGVYVRLGLVGALDGGVYIELPETMAVEIVKTLVPGPERSLLDETARSVLMELGNILASVFVAYFDQFLGLRTLPTPPEFSLVPLDHPDFAEDFFAEFLWSKNQDRAAILIGLEQSALDILLAG